MLETESPREQSGRDSLSRYKAQARSAAMAVLSILEGQKIDRVYCDLHDDFVVRENDDESYIYIFYQVKTKKKQNHNWSLNEVFGLLEKPTKQQQQRTDKIKNSFVGKLLLHTVVFDKCCGAIVFQTNINLDDKVEELLADIESGNFNNQYTNILIEKFNACFSDLISQELTSDEIKRKLSKLRFESDLQHLKEGNDNFEPLARAKIYQFSEVDLQYAETQEILIKLLALVERKSCGVIGKLTAESIEIHAGISIDDLLPILSISKDAYNNLKEGGDSKAIKSASIIQRTLLSAGAGLELVEYCSRCKTQWDTWLRKNRHTIPELDLNIISNEINTLLNKFQENGNLLSLRSLIKELKKKLEIEDLLYDLTEDLILGGIFSQLVKAKS